jgi:alkenylglycerophosphocholine hydrolase
MNTMRDRALLGVSLGLSLVYILTVNASFPGRFAVKAGSIAVLSVMALLRGHRALALGLFLSSIGDALLDISGKLFTAGLFAFLCAHLAYIAAFIRGRVHAPLGMARWAAIGAVTAFSCGFAAWLIPSAGTLALPVTLYMGAITAMVVSSIAACLPGVWAPSGAVLFLISDAILAANRFKTPIAGRDYLVWGTYYFGQMLIALGTTRSRTAPEEQDSRSRALGRAAR